MTNTKFSYSLLQLYWVPIAFAVHVLMPLAGADNVVSVDSQYVAVVPAEIELLVHLNSDENLGLLHLELEFDPTVINTGSVQLTPVAGRFDALNPDEIYFDVDVDFVSWTIADFQGNRIVVPAGAGPLLVARFTLNETIGSGTTEIRVRMASANDVELNPVSLTKEPGLLYGPPANLSLDIDGNGVADALSDGILILRYLANIRGAALLAGAVRADCTECSIDRVEDRLHVADLFDILDVDKNGTPDAATDGLVILRYLFGFRGPTMTTDAVATHNCQQCQPDEIAAFLSLVR